MEFDNVTAWISTFAIAITGGGGGVYFTGRNKVDKSEHTKDLGHIKELMEAKLDPMAEDIREIKETLKGGPS